MWTLRTMFTYLARHLASGRVTQSVKTRGRDRRSPELVECCFTSIGLLGTGAQDVHLDFHTAPEIY